MQSTSMKKVGKFLMDWAAVLTLVVSVVFFTLMKGNAFLSSANLVNILRSMSAVQSSR